MVREVEKIALFTQMFSGLEGPEEFKITNDPQADPQALVDIARKYVTENPEVAAAALANEQFPEEELIRFVNDALKGDNPDAVQLLQGVLNNTNIPDQVIDLLVTHPSAEVRTAVAWRGVRNEEESAPLPAQLYKLLQDPEVNVQVGAASNPNTPIEILKSFIDAVGMNTTKYAPVVLAIAERNDLPAELAEKLQGSRIESIRDAASGGGVAAEEPLAMTGSNAIASFVKLASVFEKVSKHKDQLPGGLADKKKPKDFDKKQLAKGKKVEMEHVDDPKKALEIAMDHLVEDSKYYDKLEKMEGDKHS